MDKLSKEEIDAKIAKLHKRIRKLESHLRSREQKAAVEAMRGRPETVRDHCRMCDSLREFHKSATCYACTDCGFLQNC